ncbi:hypothetical protein [Parasediminibacterium sp. JCM 36343]|uniref:hypothetical protein n=1 Tax=Parasediminibacterium sp. JCM 36343 TaxID=3374279 RepID=UPI00397955D2
MDLLFVCVIWQICSCTKFSTDNNNIAPAVPVAVVPITDSVPLCGSISGTMLAGKTYIISCDILVDTGKSLTIQPGVKLIFQNQAGVIVKGNLFSLGTKENPIWFTVAGQTKTDNPKIGYKASKDSAFAGLWKGVAADVTCNYLVFKWTHLEYVGSLAGYTGGVANSQYFSVSGQKQTDNGYAVFFSNTKGYLVFEDSWVYGCINDAIRVGGGGGKFAIMRSTFEKCGKSSNDGLNIKSGGVGVLAYNLCVGGATNSLKAANSGAVAGVPTCNVDAYNNTIVNSGYRNASTKGGSINYENSARGRVFNNLMVNCKYGLRLSTLLPDTAYMYNGNYGYNYYWADSLSVANEFIPFTPGSVTKPVATDFPNPFTYLPANYNYQPDASYDGSSAVQVGNPLFLNYPLPVKGGYNLGDINAIGNFNFGLQASSPCIGIGFKGFSPLQVVPTDPIYGVTEFTLPGSDIGCYQFNGTGNRH